MSEGKILSVREVALELSGQGTVAHIRGWKSKNSDIFIHPNEAMGRFVAEIFKVPHFQQILSRQAILEGRPVADPFLIAAAKILDGVVVTEETKVENAAKIPNVCEHFKVPCINLEEMLAREGVTF